MKYVIIGNSAAAIGTIEGIRQIDQEGSISVLTTESYHTYSRPLISYLLQGKTNEEKMKYRSDNFYEENNCHLIFQKAAKIDANRQEVITAEKTALSYDKLMIATGSRPFIPNITGLKKVKNLFTFMSLDDAKKLHESLNERSRVLILGAGLIGLKCAEGIADSVRNITIVDLASQILPSILDETSASMVQKHINTKGIKFILNDSVDSFEYGKATLSSGKEIDFDLLVIAVGVRPNIDLAQQAGIATDKGIIINEHCMTTQENIYAAGDCTQSYDISLGQSRVLALLPNAYMQGECAGIHMAGEEKPYTKAIPMNAIGFFGLHMITAGSYIGKDFKVKTEKGYKRLFYQDNHLKGFILVEDIKRAGIYTALIREQTPLDSIDFNLIKNNPQLMAFSENDRRKILGGHQ